MKKKQAHKFFNPLLLHYLMVSQPFFSFDPPLFHRRTSTCSKIPPFDPSQPPCTTQLTWSSREIARIHKISISRSRLAIYRVGCASLKQAKKGQFCPASRRECQLGFNRVKERTRPIWFLNCETRVSNVFTKLARFDRINKTGDAFGCCLLF